MKYTVLFIFIILTACHSHTGGLRKDLSKALKIDLNPLIEELEFITIDYKQKTNNWPDNVNDYQKMYGDIVLLLIDQFMTLNFNNPGDSLIIEYKLKRSYKLRTPIFEIIEPKFYGDSAQYEIESVKEYDRENNRFKNFEEGKLIFVKINQDFKIVHSYKGGQKASNINKKEK